MTHELAPVAPALIERRNHARTLMARGVGLLLASPITIVIAGLVGAILGGAGTELVGLVGSIGMAVCAGAGIAAMIVGGVRYRRLTAEIEGWPRPLPAARVVERDQR